MTYYAAPYKTPEFIPRATAVRVTMAPRDGAGTAATVASGTYTLYNDSGDTIIDAASVSIDSDGSAYYDIGSGVITASYDYSVRWVEQWDLTTSESVALAITREVHLVRTRPEPRIDAADLLRRHPDVATQYTTAQTQMFVDDAWDILIGRMISDGRYPQHIMSTWVLSEPHTSLSLSLLFRSASTYASGRGKYTELADFYMERYEDTWGKTTWSVDRDQDLVIDGTGEAAEPVVYLTATPSWWSGN